jgi:hypothetical protein
MPIFNTAQQDFLLPHDNPPEIAGAVNHFERRTGNISVLGLWKEIFYNDLGWVMTTARSLEDSRLEIIPSWTWLSAKWGIRPRNYPDERKISGTPSIIDGNVCWEDEPYTSSLLSARLVLPPKPIVLQRGSEEEEFIWRRCRGPAETKDDDYYHPGALELLDRGADIGVFVPYEFWTGSHVME